MEIKGIELLPKPVSTGRTAALSFWARAVGIPLVIILQLIFLSVLAFRVKIESDLSVLAESAAQKEEILEHSAGFEQAFLDTQDRLDLRRQISGKICYACADAQVKALAPAGVEITSLLIENDRTELSARAAQGAPFAVFVGNILKEDAVRSAAIVSGGLDRSGNFVFAMELTLDSGKVGTR